MKGLLLKDWYVIVANFRSVIVMILVCSVAGGIMEGNLFFTYYACILSSMVGINLIAYEEKEKWEHYVAALPYTRTQLVSLKYIVSLCFALFAVLVNVTTQSAFMLYSGTFQAARLLSMLLSFIPLALLPVAIMFPFIFKFGVTKGRLLYFIVIGGFFALVGILMSNDFLRTAFVPGLPVSFMILVVSLMAYVLSWVLSVHFYQSKEL